LARCCRANLASMTRYAPPALTATPARLWLASRPATGLPDREAPQDQARRWHSLLPGLRGWCSVDTTHYGIVGAESARSVADIINEAVR
jgi:thioesterase domain-containing protein